LFAGRNHHGLFELILLGIGDLLICESQLMMTDRYDIAVLQGMFLDVS
jgi:hypothetical protein